ncbi:SWIM zinc finger domain-containing protein [Myxosarcina sp. GI1]|uniref:SWIM zinc finger family protein n=1 Tax=Myxosarcina sp. GI1 TaxID=1541065 RepID=UPI000AB0032B|nr:SWIM zinc finger family protein [Myxosarcina sp. GI1]
MTIPQLSQEMIRRHASCQSWQKGQTYYRDGCVRKVVRRGELVTAEVMGNDIRPYRVSIGLGQEEVDTAYCSCPYDFGGWCKHIVATLLVCLHQPEIIEQRQGLEQILDRLNEVQTQTLIQELVADKPELIDDIEYFANRLVPTVVIQSKPAILQHRISVDSNHIRSQVRYILEDSVRHFEYGGEEDIATEEISNLIQDAQMYTQQGDSWNAIEMLTAITEACIEHWDLVDDYGVDNGDVASELNTVWCETILSTEISEAEKVDLEVNFEFWCNSWGGYFDMAIAALEQGWDYPPLTKVLQGSTAVDIWQEAKPDYAQDLALIRLQILERQQRDEEYLYLARAEGLITRYLTMLVSLARVAEAMQAAQSQTITMEQALALSQALINQQNAQLEALEIAKQGLNLPGECQYDLATWTSEIALEAGDRVLAIKAKVKAFQAQPSFADYRQVEKLAADNWTNLKGELLAALAAYNNWWDADKAKVDIYLYEGLIAKAIAVVNKLTYDYYGLTGRVMDAAIATHSDWD